MSTIALRVRDDLNREFGVLKSQKIDRWLANFRSNEVVPIDNCQGGTIAIGGQLQFSGTAWDVYWQFMHPCLVQTLAELLEKYETEMLGLPDSTRPLIISQVQGQMRAFVRRVYGHMVEVDSTLRSHNGQPPERPYSPVTQLAAADQWIDERIGALLQIKSAPRFDQSNRPASAEKSELIILQPNFMGMGIDLKEMWRRVCSAFRS